MKIGEMIRQKRQAKGWSVRELGRRTGIPHALVSQIETGWVKCPTFEKVVKMSRALGMSLDLAAGTVDLWNGNY